MKPEEGKHMSMFEIIWVTRSDIVCWGFNEIYESPPQIRSRSEDLFSNAHQMMKNVENEWKKESFLLFWKIGVSCENVYKFLVSAFLSASSCSTFFFPLTRRSLDCSFVRCVPCQLTIIVWKIVDWQRDEIFPEKSSPVRVENVVWKLSIISEG